MSIPVPSGKVEGPAPGLDSMMTKGNLKRVLPLPLDALRALKSVISVSGKTYVIPCQPGEKYQQSDSLALSFQNTFRISTTALPSALDLAAHFQLVKQIFASEAFESTALAFAADFDWPEGVLSRDRDLLQSLGSLDMVLDHHSTIHRAAGWNPERIHQWLSNDPRLSLLLTMATHGGEVDTDPDFVPFRHAGSLRPLQQRLLPVYRYHAHKMWKAEKGLLFRLSDIPASTLEYMHTGNSCHLVPKPDTPEGRFIIDASNVSEGRVPLNGTTAKEQAILRYGAVCLPNIRGVLSRWDDYRRRWNLQWSDLLIFKEDIKSCFNHLRWSTRSSKLLATMVDPDVVSVMLTGGFGHTSTPMQWDVVGGAILCRVEEGCSPSSNLSAPPNDIGQLDSPVNMYVDDTFDVGRSDHVRVARDRVVLVSEGQVRQSPQKKVSLLLVQTSSDITSIVWRPQSVPRIGRSASSSMFYSVSVVPIDNHWCYGSASLHW